MFRKLCNTGICTVESHKDRRRMIRQFQKIGLGHMTFQVPKKTDSGLVAWMHKHMARIPNNNNVVIANGDAVFMAPPVLEEAPPFDWDALYFGGCPKAILEHTTPHWKQCTMDVCNFIIIRKRIMQRLLRHLKHTKGKSIAQCLEGLGLKTYCHAPQFIGSLAASRSGQTGIYKMHQTQQTIARVPVSIKAKCPNEIHLVTPCIGVSETNKDLLIFQLIRMYLPKCPRVVWHHAGAEWDNIDLINKHHKRIDIEAHPDVMQTAWHERANVIIETVPDDAAVFILKAGYVYDRDYIRKTVSVLEQCLINAVPETVVYEREHNATRVYRPRDINGHCVVPDYAFLAFWKRAWVQRALGELALGFVGSRLEECGWSPDIEGFWVVERTDWDKLEEGGREFPIDVYKGFI